MMVHEQELLQSELSELRRLLKRTPSSAVIDRASIHARLKSIEEQLEQVPVTRRPQPAILTFDGPPVIGSSGIFADFGTKAAGKFVETIAAFAASLKHTLGTRGPLPNPDEYRLLIRGVARGSFGFQFEEYVTNAALDTKDLTTVEQAIENTRHLLQATLESDEELTDAIADSSPRAVAALREFLESVAEYDAVCHLQFRDKVFRFRDVNEVRRSARRLEEDNVKKAVRNLRGSFLGALPIQRRFEFRIEGSEEIIRGGISPEIEGPESINDIRHKPVIITVQTVQVGEGRPRYLLLNYEVD